MPFKCYFSRLMLYILQHLVRQYSALLGIEVYWWYCMCKYPFNYVTTWFYCTRLKMDSNTGSSDSSREIINAIDKLQDCRYVTPNEVLWRLSKYDIHYTSLSLQIFHVILDGMKIDSMYRFPIRHVPKKSFSVNKAHILPSTKVRQILFIDRLYFFLISTLFTIKD